MRFCMLLYCPEDIPPPPTRPPPRPPSPAHRPRPPPNPPPPTTRPPAELAAAAAQGGGLTPPAAGGGLTPPVAGGGLNPPAAGGGLTPPAAGAGGGLTALPVAVPSAYTLARELGNRLPFMLGDVSTRHCTSYDGKFVWIALQFGRVTRGSAVWVTPNMDGHITLLYATTKVLASTLEARVAQLRERVARLRTDALVAAGLFHAELAQPDYAWIDLLATCRMHATLHSLAHIVTGGDSCLSRFWTRPAFHLSFSTPAGVSCAAPWNWSAHCR